MNIQIERRIRAAEKTVAVLQPSARQVKIMCSPPDDSDETEVARYRAEVEQAVRDGFFVIQLVPLQPVAEGAKT
jgi:hypothetical protein